MAEWQDPSYPSLDEIFSVYSGSYLPTEILLQPDASKRHYALSKLLRSKREAMEKPIYPPIDWEDVHALHGQRYGEQIGTYIILCSNGFPWWPDIVAFQLDLEELPF